MSNLFDVQDCFNSHASADGVIAKYSGGWPIEHTFEWPTDASRLIPDVACNSWIPHENALALSGMHGPESAWSAERLTYPAATSLSDRTGTQLFSTSFLQQPSPPDSVTDFWQPPLVHYPPVCEEATLDGIWEGLIPQSVHTIPLPECHPTKKQTAHSLSKCVRASRLSPHSVPPRSRRSPYSLRPDMKRRGDPSAAVCQCQWFDGVSTCSAIVTGTKSAIAQHLQTAHGIRLKADKTIQLCLWEGCHTPMRGESIARHILTVHMLDRVPCPNCGSYFARVDSMQRHQKTCLAKGEYVPDACNDLAFHTETS